MANKKTPTRRDARNVRMQQIIFVLFGIIVILSMVLSLMQ